MAASDTLIFIAREIIQFYYGGQVLTFSPPAGVIKDLEVVDGDAFKAGLAVFMDENRIIPGDSGVLLSESVCFISEPVLKDQNSEKALADFLSALPFESPVARIFGDKIVGTNRDLYQAVNEVVGQKGGKIKMVSPSFLSRETFDKRQLDGDLVKFVLANEDEFAKATFDYEAALPIATGTQPQTKKGSKRTTILVAVFAVLLVILIWLLTTLS